MSAYNVMNRLALVAVTAALVLSGCIGSSEEPEEVATQSVETNADNTKVKVTEDGVTVDTGTGTGTVVDEEGNEISIGTAWVREYWGTQASLPLGEETRRTGHLVGSSSAQAYAFGRWARIELAPGKIVAPGTGSLELTVTYSPPPTMANAKLYLRYATAAGIEYSDWQQVVAGTPVDVKVGEKDWDAPLAARSLWMFDVRVLADGSDPLDSPVTLKVVAKRAPGDLPAFDPPADRWAESNKLDLVKGLKREVLFMEADPAVFGWWVGSGNVIRPAENAIVPPGSKLITATISWTNPGAAKPILYYRWSADNWGPMDVTEDGAMQRTFTFAVPEKLVDSPYQARTPWYFFFGAEGSNGPVGVAGPGTFTFDVVVGK
ncbi:MAG TPA: hypothetical protein VM681_03635 [Candidatus Thermoplasmatota archaeon]|nr:hypothetical protein [Candidatus Thermoplasmatota archaeon]